MILLGLIIGSIVLAILLFVATGAMLGSDDGEAAAGFFLFLGMSALAISIGLACEFGAQYGRAINAAETCRALRQTVIEQKALLANDDLTLGGGLEALEVRKTLLQTIRDYEDARARVRYINRSAWWFFKAGEPND